MARGDRPDARRRGANRMNPTERRDAEHAFRARLHALLGAGAGTGSAQLDVLYTDARRCLGATHEVTLTVEGHLCHEHSRSLPADEAMAAGTDLFERARAVLAPGHPTL